MALDYKKAGVDIAAGEALVDWLKSESQGSQPHQERLVSGIGGFAALFRAQFPEMKKPCLVSATDGVGTKLKLAVEFDRYEGIGQDLVAMCVNDLICCGARPLFFLDYYAVGQLDLNRAKVFLSGLRNACVESDCALIGGETAEMPGVYQGKDFDCAGFAVGVVDEDKVLGAHRVQEGDVLVGVPSSGFHSNGYSLLRQVFVEDRSEWVDELLKPTALYVKALHEVLSVSDQVHAVAHITGGGMDNLLRVLPDGFSAILRPWDIPKPFKVVQERAQLSQEQLLKTFNCGVGMILVVSPSQASAIHQSLRRSGFSSFDLGEVVASPGQEKQWQL
ncbi:MAG: phosphoribosylformylglycinamidine cyclo-ligase [Pseudobdellovibrionaceae bacterium]|nr:phosphoribosylformylglycinamidine cyclo-ligase [Bdellovibrionales bacterium]USN48348.1 MAG: phosphoribosylformylglycinamidine cyclo-ligase [Pseudobdellovibrionaceae bacterium]